MKRISLIVYKTKEEFGYTHVSIHVQGEEKEWCYASENGVQPAPLQQFQPEIWQCTHVVPIGTVDDNFNIEENALTLTTVFSPDQYDLYLNNCWHFAAALLKTIVPETDVYDAIYRSSDFHFGLPPYSTCVIYSVLWRYYTTAKQVTEWKQYCEETIQSYREYVTGFCKKGKQV